MVAANDRVPCPQCGGLIHPISGRCKHCKADLATARGARSSAPVQLPSLSATPAPLPVQAAAAAPSPWAPPPKPAYSPVPVAGAVTAPLAGTDSQPVLPPRVTARQMAVPETERAWWKSWPILVILVASVAIIVAILMLVIPHGRSEAAGKKDLPVGPAPDRMDTDPTVPGANGLPAQPSPPANGGGSAADPWNGKSGQADPPPAAKDPNRLPPPDPLPPDPTPDPDDDTLGLGGILGGGGNSAGTGNPLGNLGSPGMMGAMLQHGCARAQACAMDPMVKQACAQIGPMLSQMPKQVPSCAAAQRCLDQIDKLDCATNLDGLAGILALQTKIDACVDALQCT